MPTTTLERSPRTTLPAEHRVNTGGAAAWLVLAAGVSSVFSFGVGYYALRFLAETLALGLQ